MSKAKRWTVSLPNPDGYDIKPVTMKHFIKPTEIVLAADYDARLAELEHAEHNGDIWCERASKAEARLAEAKEWIVNARHHDNCKVVRGDESCTCGRAKLLRPAASASTGESGVNHE